MTDGVTTRALARLARRLTIRPRAGAARRAPARRGAVVAVGVGVLVFAAVQVGLSSASAVTHVIADPVYGDKERRLSRLERAAPPGTPRVILLGTSRTGFAFAAGRTQQAAAEAGTPAVAFNFGVPGAGPIAHRLFLGRLIAEGHRPDLLVLEILPPILADLPDGPREATIITGDTLTSDEVELASRYGVPGERLRRQWLEAAQSPVYAHRFKLLGRLFPSALSWQLRYDWGRTPDPNGWNRADVLEVTDEERTRGVIASAREYRGMLQHDLPAGPSVTALRDTLELCRAEGIPVVLAILPESTSFRALYPPAAEVKLSRFLAGLTAEFGYPVTDARSWTPDTAFMDGHHLLRPGGEAFTDRLTAEVILPFLRTRSAGRFAP